jgi:hypothetical protein
MACVSLIGCGTEPVPVKTRPNPVLENEIATTATEARAMDSPFGKYDIVFKQKINKRWHEILKADPPTNEKPGKVVLTFYLHFDGKVTHLEVALSEVGDQLTLACKRAILESAPFATWPDEMKRMVGATYREVTFSFDYH